MKPRGGAQRNWAEPAGYSTGIRPPPPKRISSPRWRFRWRRRPPRRRASGDTVTLYTDEAVPAAIGIGRTITLEGYDTEKTLSIDGYSGAVFSVNAGGSLTLDEYVTLLGKSGNSTEVVMVDGVSAALTIKAGSKITGNASGSSEAGGVSVVNGGRFTMEGGKISGTSAASSAAIGLPTAAVCMPGPAPATAPPP